MTARRSSIRRATLGGAENSVVEATEQATTDWLRRQKADATRQAGRLGVDRKRPVFGNVGASKLLGVLGAEWFAEVTAVEMPGRVVWCNFELARALGFDVPASNCMTPEFHAQLLEALSYRVPEPGAAIDARKRTIKLYADKYGGEGVRPALGAGRAGFLPYGNLCMKGIGLTPLFKHDDPDDFEHSHGGLTMDEAIAEALFGEVNANLFTQGSARILAIIDHGEFITYPEGHKVPRVLAARAGTQLRPAHLLASRVRRPGARLALFVRITRATGQLVTRPQPAAGGPETPDVKATMLRVVDDHARTSAEQFRWRVIHGALSSSNMELSGAMLDLATESTQPRTAPIYVLPYPDSTYGREHIERALQLRPIYRALVRDVPEAQRATHNATPLDLPGEMDKAYQKHLQVSLLTAAGLKAEVAERLQAQHTELARRFAAVIVQMAQLRNPGVVNAGRTPVAAVSVLDIFHLLQTFPPTYFAAPHANQTAQIHAALRPIFKGNRFHVARKQALVAALVEQFAAVYRELMDTCAALAPEFYGDRQNMQASIAARAAFENEPISFLYRANIYKEFEQVVAAYKADSDDALFREIIDRRVTASLRNVDALLTQGTARRMSDGGFELQRRTIDGVNYAVRAWADEKQTRCLHVSLAVERVGGAYVTSLPAAPRLSGRQIKSLRYRFTVDGAAAGEVGARLVRDEQDQLVIEFADITIFPPIGLLAGAFHLGGLAAAEATPWAAAGGAYPFAVPDKRELARLTGGPVRARVGRRPLRPARDSAAGLRADAGRRAELRRARRGGR
ncbi:MAG TPA: hypothetical protein VF546_02580 [Pyrinomonadaceae bacterium]|jgi:hypothetical protein